MAELKLCPFCKSEARLVMVGRGVSDVRLTAGYRVKCTNDNCGVKTPVFESIAEFLLNGELHLVSDGALEAALLWNRRDGDGNV